MRGTPMPSMTRIIGPADHRSRDPLTLLMGAIVIASLLLTFIIALALVFDARYRDFPFAPLTAVAVPLLVHGLVVKHASGARGAAEVAGAAVLLMSVPYIVFNETFANWQSLWLCAMLVVFAISLLRVRDARS
jgi:glucan 1,3-beta-glucosidase